MDTIQIKDKKFTVSIKEQDILKEVPALQMKSIAIWLVKILCFSAS